MKVASPQPLQPLPPLPPSPAAPSASPAPAAPRREPHGHEQPPHSGPSPALPPYLTVSDVPLTPGATLTGLAAQPIAHKPAVHLSASPIATVAGPAPGPVSGLIFNHKAPVQVPMDLEPIAYKPSPPIIGGMQLAPVSPVGAPGAVSGSAPTASREEIAALELLLRSPESQAIVRDFGSASASASGVPGGNAVADSIIQRYGPDLAARLNQLHQAQNAVRQQYLDAMNAMRQARLPTQRTPEWYEAANGRSLPGWHFVENGVRFAGSPTDIPTGFRLGRFGDTGHWEFDPIDFTRHWAAGDSPAQRAFASLYGPDPLEFRYERRDSLSAGMNVRQHYYLGEQQLDISDVRNHGRGETFSEPWRHLRDPATGHEYIVTNTRPDSRLEPLGGAIDPARPPNLYHPEAVWFDPVHGWVTDPGNIKVKRDWFDRLVGFAATSFFAVVSGGVAGALTSSLIGQAAFTEAATGLMQQGTSGDGFSFRDVLRGAVGGALTAGLTQAAGLGGAASAAGAGERLMRITGQATIQGAIQDVLGGNFRDGFVQGLLSGAAGEVRARIDASIASQLNLSASQRSMMHLLSRATGSALQALGNPNDPAAAFAQDFLGSVMSGLPMPQARPAAARDAREATLALLDETFGNTARDPRDTLLLAAGPDAGVWTESLSRSFDFGRGYAEGSGMSLLQTGEAIAAVARNPGQFIDGVRALITSSQARQQLGEAIINRINYDLREFNHAYNTGDWRRAGQQFGLMVSTLAQAAGGAQGLVRGAQTAARGGARLAGRGLEALGESLRNGNPAPRGAGRFQTGAVGDLGGPGATPSGVRTPATSGGTANSASGVELGLDLRTIQSANEVVESLQRTGKLPPNYVTSNVARELGWKPGRALNNHVPGGQMGGDVFMNEPRVVPNSAGRIWYEADIGLQNTISRARQPGTRLVYSNDGLLYVTRDHYENVIYIGRWK